MPSMPLSIRMRKDQGVFTTIENVALKIVAKWVDRMKPDIPFEFHEEIEGLYRGCREANSDTKVTLRNLWELNVGTDAILSHAYTGKLFARVTSPSGMRLPLRCNSYVAPGDKKRQFFGRDFIFPTGDVYQHVACLIVYGADSSRANKRYSFVSQTAPGIVGSPAAVNSEGVAIGINMTASHLCNPNRPGFNGLLLNRYCMELAKSAPDAVELVLGAQRGVAWLYPIADASGKACIVEAGMQLDESERFPYLDYIPHYYRRRLPDLSVHRENAKKYGNKPPDRGAFVRETDYNYPTDFIKDWNEGLWNAFDRNLFEKLLDGFGDLGAIIAAIFTLEDGKACFPFIGKW